MKLFSIACSMWFSTTVFASTNENISFLENVREEARRYSEADLSKWRFGDGIAAVPESADVKNLEQLRLLVAANPDRYEGYVMYGLHFFIQHDYEVAVAAYGMAVDIVRANKIAQPVDFGKYYELSLAMLFSKEHDKDKVMALRTFEKIVDYDFTFFDREPRLANCISLAALDYYGKGDQKKAMELIRRARALKKLPPDIAALLGQIAERIEKNVEPTNTPYSSPALQVQER